MSPQNHSERDEAMVISPKMGDEIQVEKGFNFLTLHFDGKQWIPAGITPMPTLDFNKHAFAQ